MGMTRSAWMAAASAHRGPPINHHSPLPARSAQASGLRARARFELMDPVAEEDPVAACLRPPVRPAARAGIATSASDAGRRAVWVGTRSTRTPCMSRSAMSIREGSGVADVTRTNHGVLGGPPGVPDLCRRPDSTVRVVAASRTSSSTVTAVTSGPAPGPVSTAGCRRRLRQMRSRPGGPVRVDSPARRGAAVRTSGSSPAQPRPEPRSFSVPSSR
jgi:hypothetical protein